jgi:hypothetical protein
VTVQPIRLFGDPVLRTAAEVVTDFDKELRTLVADLAETMLNAPGTWSIPYCTSRTRRSRTGPRAACRSRD